MKKKSVIIVIVVGVLLILAGVVAGLLIHKKNVEDNTFVAERSAICVKKDGTIVEAGIEEFDTTVYDATELDSFIRDEVIKYNTSAGEERITVQQITVENNIATMYLEYKSAKDYEAFHGETFFVGSLSDAVATGYLDDVEFYTIYDATVGRKISLSEVAGEDLKVVIMSERLGIYVKGEIAYISTNMKLIDKGTAFLNENVADTEEYLVVIFTQNKR